MKEVEAPATGSPFFDFRFMPLGIICGPGKRCLARHVQDRTRDIFFFFTITIITISPSRKTDLQHFLLPPAWLAAMFNSKDGFIEALVRGYRVDFLSSQDYSDLSQCETLEDVRTFLVFSFFFSLFGRSNNYEVGYWLCVCNRCTSEATIFASIYNSFSLHGKIGSGF